MRRGTFCQLHGNTDVPCPECAAAEDEQITRLTRERDEARQQLIDRGLSDCTFDALDTEIGKLRRERDDLRALLLEVAGAQPLGNALGEYIDVQMPSRVWRAVKAEGRDG